MTETSVRVLGIDPGSARMGYGVVDTDGSNLAVVAYGCLETPPDRSAAERLHLLHRDLCALLDRYEPQEVAVEELFFAKNARTAIAVAQARGVALLGAAQHGCVVAEYTPLQVKVGVVGHGAAKKFQVQHMVTVVLALPAPPEPDDTADALAVAICHCYRRGGSAGASEQGSTGVGDTLSPVASQLPCPLVPALPGSPI